MKKLFTLAVALVATYGMASAAVIFDEKFDYEGVDIKDVTEFVTSQSVDADVYTPVSTVEWEVPVGRTFPNPQTPLVYSVGEMAFINSGEGNRLISNITSCGTSNAEIRTKKSFDGGTNGTTLYLSFLWSPMGIPQNQSQTNIAAINNENSFAAVVWVGNPTGTATPAGENATGFRFGVTKGSTTGAHISWGEVFSTEDNINKTFLIVLKYEVGSTGAAYDANLSNDREDDLAPAAIYVNPVLGSTEEPAAYKTGSIGGSSAVTRTSVNNLHLRANGNNRACFGMGGFRLSTTWEDAVEAKEADPTGVGEIVDNGAVVSVKFYNIQGMEISEPANGLYIEKTVFENGATEVVKKMKK